MDRTAFEAELQREGRQVVTVTMQPNQVNPEHAHDFEARLMVVAGAMTVDYGDRAIPTTRATPSPCSSAAAMPNLPVPPAPPTSPAA